MKNGNLQLICVLQRLTMLIVKSGVIIQTDLYLSSNCAHVKSLIHDHFIGKHQSGFGLIHLEMPSVKFYPLDFQTFNSHVPIVRFSWCLKCTLKVSKSQPLIWNNIKWTQTIPKINWFADAEIFLFRLRNKCWNYLTKRVTHEGISVIKASDLSIILDYAHFVTKEPAKYSSKLCIGHVLDR